MGAVASLRYGTQLRHPWKTKFKTWRISSYQAASSHSKRYSILCTCRRTVTLLSHVNSCSLSAGACWDCGMSTLSSQRWDIVHSHTIPISRELVSARTQKQGTAFANDTRRTKETTETFQIKEVAPATKKLGGEGAELSPYSLYLKLFTPFRPVLCGQTNICNIANDASMRINWTELFWLKQRDKHEAQVPGVGKFWNFVAVESRSILRMKK
jgi:hypothetical protein